MAADGAHQQEGGGRRRAVTGGAHQREGGGWRHAPARGQKAVAGGAHQQEGGGRRAPAKGLWAAAGDGRLRQEGRRSARHDKRVGDQPGKERSDTTRESAVRPGREEATLQEGRRSTKKG